LLKFAWTCQTSGGEINKLYPKYIGLQEGGKLVNSLELR
jgi:hypothetical protein